MEILHKLAPPLVKLCGYGGQHLAVLGTFRSNIQLQNMVLKDVLFYVMENECTPVLGTTALLNQINNGFKIDIKNKQLTLDDKATPLLIINQNEISTEHEGNVIIENETRKINMVAMTQRTIPPRSEIMLQVKSKSDIGNYGYFVTEPQREFNNDLIVANSIHTLGNLETSTFIRIMNTSENQKTIIEGTNLVMMKEIKASALTERQSNNNTISDENRIQNILNEIGVTEIPKKYRKEVTALVREFHDIFALDGEQLATTNAAEYHINTGDSAPVSSQKYRTPYYLRDEMKHIIDHNVKTGLMEKCSSPWAAPCLLVKKPNGKYRL